MKKDTIIRTVILIIALANQFLAIYGKSPIPIEDEVITELLSTAFTVATALAAWWKNNSFTGAAIMADEYMKELKEGGVK